MMCGCVDGTPRKLRIGGREHVGYPDTWVVSVQHPRRSQSIRAIGKSQHNRISGCHDQHEMRSGRATSEGLGEGVQFHSRAWCFLGINRG